MRIALFISSLQEGGAERVLSLLANALHRRGHQVVLVLLDGEDIRPLHPLDPGVRVIATGLNRASASRLRGLAANLGRIRRLRSTFVGIRPDVLLSFMDRSNVLAVLATRGTGIPTIASERTDPRTTSLSAPWRWLRLLAYSLCEGLVTQSPGAKAFFPPWIRRKSVVLPNPVPTPAAPGPADRAAGPERVAIAMGRLDPEKGFDVLLEAFALALPDCPGWSLHLLGEGPERGGLEALAARLGLQGRIQMPGWVLEPNPLLQAADLFLLPSRVEGFPNALCEAMACGLPVIATGCADSIGTILEDGAAGRIVPPDDAPSLARAMVDLMTDPDGRAALGARARQSVSRFQGSAVIEAWERYLEASSSRAPAAGAASRLKEDP